MRSLSFLSLGVLIHCLADSTSAGMVTFGSGENQFSMDFVNIDSPGNPADTTGSPNPAGAVGYSYLMGKYEVSEDMIAKYNAGFGAANALLITFDNRGPNKPATSVSWNEAARFVNWLNTSTGGFAAYKFTTSGVNDNIALWTPMDTLDYDPLNPFRSLRSNYVIPTFNEWYKAAYYDPLLNSYFDFPTASNVIPTPVASGTAAGTAVYNGQVGPADIDAAGGLSAFQTMGQGGNVVEWEESEFDLVNDNVSADRGRRGGRWAADFTALLSTGRGIDGPTAEGSAVGFRVVSLSAVPEPNSMLLLSFGLAAIMQRRSCSKK